MGFDAESLKGIKAEAEKIGVPWQSLAAVALVESAGRPLWDGLCPIRIEGHYFHRLLPAAKRADAVAKGFASPKAGQVRNPQKMADRYAMLEKMKLIDESAALESCSWGLGQVMGAHWNDLGYSSVQSLAKEAQDSVAGQVRLMSRFIVKNNLLQALRDRDWKAFAKRYNGPSYKEYKYDEKMAEAYEQFLYGSVKETKSVMDSDGVVERGDKGLAVADLQRRLAALGYYRGNIDGIFAGGTELSVMGFQRDAFIQADGRVGPQTSKALADWTIEKSKEAKTAGRARVVYVNQFAVRNRPCTPYLEQTLASAVFEVYGPNYEAQIFSGGQPKKGMPGKRTGSIRHDDYGNGGRALDAYIIKPSGKKLEGEELARLGQYWLAKKYGGCGLEMAVGGIHLDEWKTPPAGGGMLWTYPYSDGKPWGPIVRQMLVDGNKGKLPK